MEAVHIFPEIFKHGHLGISALRPLENHSGLLYLQLIHINEGQSAAHSLSRQPIVLQLTAHGHDLFKQFLYPMGIKLIMRQTADFTQFLFLPRLVQHFLPCLDLIIRHLRTDLHPLFVQLYDLFIYPIQLSAQF